MFSFKRMAGVMKRDWANNRKTFFILMAVLFVVQIVFSFFTPSVLKFVLYIGLIVTIGKLVFWNYPDGNRRLAALLLPASNAEKYASQWLWAFVILPISVVVAVAAGQFLGYTWITLINSSIWINPFYFLCISWGFVLRILIVETVTFAGCLLFRKSRTLKTWLVAVGYFLFLFFALEKVLSIKSETSWQVSISADTENYLLKMNDEWIAPWWSSDVALAITGAVVVVFLHVWTYFRLKEEEA